MGQSHSCRSGFTRDSTVAILLLVVLALALASVLLFPYLRPERLTATALFHVSSEEISFSGEPIHFDPQRNDIYRRTQLAYLKSYFVLQSALRAPGIASLEILAPHADKVEWLKTNLDVGYQDEKSEILQVRLQGTQEQREDLRQIVDAVCDAYLKEVVFEDEQRQLVVRDAKLRASADLRKRLETRIQEHSDSTDRSPTAVAEREMGQIEINALTAAWQKLLSSMTIDDMNAMAPDRVRLIQRAAVTSDDDPSQVLR
jgi:hypothetical protein